MGQRNKPAAKRELPPKRQLFVEAYIASGCNATEAARRAGYAAPAEEGYRLLRIAQVAEAIRERVEAAKECMGADEVLARLTEQARSTLDDFLDGEQIDFDKARDLGKMHLLKSISWTKYGPRIEVYDAHAALVDLGRHHKLFTDRVEKSPEETAAEQAKADALAEVAAALDRIAARKQAPA